MSDKMLALVSSRTKTIIIAALAIIALLVTGFVEVQKEVHIIADGQKITVNTLSGNPHRILAKAGIALNPEDEFELSSKKVKDGTVIKVNRGVPITITYQGKTIELVTAKTTLREAAAGAGLPVDSIRFEPSGQIVPTAGLNARAIVLSEQVVEKEIPEHYAVVKAPDSHLEKGMEKVIQDGQDGQKKLSVRIYFEDGEEVRSEIVSETILTPATNKIVNVGTRDTVETSRGTMNFREARHMEATAYLPTDGDGQCITATGIRATRGIVAVDPRVIPLGTRVYVVGYGLALAADTGGAIKGNKIDLCMEDLTEALNFGRRMVKVYVLH